MKIYSQSDNEIIEQITPITETMEYGWDTNDYSLFTKYFSKEMKQAVNIENYNQQRKNIFNLLGKHTKLELVLIHKNPENITAIWKLHLEKREIPAVLMASYVDNNGALEITGAIHKH